MARALRGGVAGPRASHPWSSERPSAVSLLPSITTKTLVVSGGEDGARSPEWSAEVVDGTPDAELWSLPTTGHMVILERPTVVIERVLAFLDGGDASR